MLTQYMYDLVRHATGEQVSSLHPLRTGNAYTALYHVHCTSGAQFALKTGSHLETEARGLHRLAYEGIPCPYVHAQADTYLLLDWVPGTAYMPGPADADLGETLARLHRVRGLSFGWEETTYAHGLAHDNASNPSWPDFFRDQRLLAQAHAAAREGKLPAEILARIETLACALPSLLPATPEPSLCHGNLGSHNILCTRRRVASLIDPALYYGHSEMDLACFALLGQPGPDFYAGYREHGDLAPDYLVRQPLYQLIALLIQVRLLGSSYAGQLTQRLSQLGY